jgi:transketolase
MSPQGRGELLVVSQQDLELLREKALMIRTEVVRLTDIAGSGHYGSAFSIAEMLAALYYRLLRVRPEEPDWPERDRFLLGKGHAAIALFPILADLGFFDREVLDTYTRLGSPLGDHPDVKKVPGVDFSSGSIGHNLSVSVGMALGLRTRGSDARVVCLMGDGEQNEGQVWEAAASAAHFGLTNLVGIVDRNKVSSDGPTREVMNMEPLDEKWQAFGWEVRHLPDGHDLSLVIQTLAEALEGPRTDPVVVLADTVAGKGVSFMEGTWQWHLGFLGPKDKERALAELRGEAR